MASPWVRREARYRIVDIVESALEGAVLLAEHHSYTEQEFAAISDEIRRVLARHERYANQLEGTGRLDQP